MLSYIMLLTHLLQSLRPHIFCAFLPQNKGKSETNFKRNHHISTKMIPTDHRRLEPSIRLDAMLHQGPQDFNTILFRSLLPIIQDRVTVGSDKRLHVHGGSQLQTSSEDLGEEVWDYLLRGIPQFHNAQRYFDGFIVNDQARGQETHVYEQYTDYHRDMCRHFGELIGNTEQQKLARKNGRNAKSIDPLTRASLQRIVDSERLLASWRGDKSIYLALRHGDVAMQHRDRATLVFTKARIKNLRRAAEKAARYVCKTILKYNELLQYEEDIRTKNPLVRLESSPVGKVPSRTFETLAAAHAHCMGLPTNRRLAYGIGTEEERAGFDGATITDLSKGRYLTNGNLTGLADLERVDELLKRMSPLDFLFMGARVKDLFAVTDVAETMKDAEFFLKRICQGNFDQARSHTIVSGLQAYGSVVTATELPSQTQETLLAIGYVGQHLVESNFKRGDKLNHDGNNRIDFYTTPNEWATQRGKRYSFERAVTSLRYFADDELGGPGSHMIYERKQYNEVFGRDGWERRNKPLFALYQTLVEALTPVIALQERMKDPEQRPPLHNNPVYR
jgi:hypothetical protein